MTQIFLNELSIHGQYRSLEEFAIAIKTVTDVLLRAKSSDIPLAIYYTPVLYHHPVCGALKFSSCLSRIENADIKLAFRQAVQKSPIFFSWLNEPIHDQSGGVYTLNSVDVTGNSIAELAERVMRGQVGALLNFSPSLQFNVRTLNVNKGATCQISINLLCIIDDLTQWLASQFPGLVRTDYDVNSIDPPTDSQTCLRNKSQFSKKEGFHNQGRSIYLDRKTRYFFCVDNAHFGNAAHLEVFNTLGKHLGEASLNGEIDFSKADSGKRLTI